MVENAEDHFEYPRSSIDESDRLSSRRIVDRVHHAEGPRKRRAPACATPGASLVLLWDDLELTAVAVGLSAVAGAREEWAVTGIWFDAGDGWAPLLAEGFPLEKNLHDCIERAPAMLPLSGRPRLAMLGREVQCGSGYADLVAVDAMTAQPVIIEVKLEKNSDRRSVVAQVLSYASFLHRMTVDAFEQLLSTHLAKAGHASVAAAAAATVQDGSVETVAFTVDLATALADGRFRCVVVIDSAPSDLVELVDYLQTVTNERLTIDLVTVTKYAIAGHGLLVPQLIEPAHRALPTVAAATQTETALRSPGAAVFREAIDQAPPEHQHELRRLTDWAESLETARLANLQSVVGKGRWVLKVLLPGQDRGLVSLWSDHGAWISMWRSVFDGEAPRTRDKIDQLLPGQLGQGKYLKSPLTDEIMEVLRAGYLEASEAEASPAIGYAPGDNRRGAEAVITES